MGTVAAAKMSLEEFLAQPGETYHDFHELWDGEVVEVPGPSEEHVWLQERIVDLVKSKLLAADFLVMAELYLTLPDEARRVDVGAVRRSRFGKSDRPFFGSPELVVEVLSESNKVMDLDRLREKCFEYGCLQFWVVNCEFRSILVYEAREQVRMFSDRRSDMIPIKVLRGETGEPTSAQDVIPVKDIFSVFD